MSRNKWGICAAAAALVLAAGIGVYLSAAHDDSPPAPAAIPGRPGAVLPVAALGDEPKEETKELAAVRKTAAEFVKAFNSGQAKAVAAFWTKDGEYIGAEGEPLKGRDAIEKAYVEFFKNHPKAKIEINVESVRMFGKHSALEEGTLKLFLPGDKTGGESRYTALHVREEDGWHAASVREWPLDPSQSISLKDVEWLIGDWVAKTDEAEVRTSYAWDEDKLFLRGRYTLKRGGKVASSGTMIIAKDPAGSLRSWIFDSSGALSDSAWSRDDNRWIIEAAGTLPDGSDVTAVHVLIPLGPDSFTWQTLERTAGGSDLPGTPPIKVNRVKAGK